MPLHEDVSTLSPKQIIDTQEKNDALYDRR